MTQDLKNKILETMNDSLGYSVSPALLIEVSNRIEKLVDIAFINAISEGCNIKDILQSCGLKITSQ
jgi:hypothetical protein